MTHSIFLFKEQILTGGTFAVFFGKIVKLVKGRGLTNREIMDLVRFRLGGRYCYQLKD